MHELSLTSGIISQAEARAALCGARRISALTARFGSDSAGVAECVRLYFDILAEGTACEGAELTVETSPALLSCPECGKLFERRPLSFACPDCKTDGLPTDMREEECVLVSITVEEEAE